jgi:hypothetical protein
MARNKRRTTDELIAELRDFNHYESADRMEWLQKSLDSRDEEE